MNLLKRSTAILYRLKRLNGVEVTFKRATTDTVNLETGIVTIGANETIVKRAVVLSARELRGGKYAAGLDSAFKYGGYLDETKRLVIIDAKDLPETFIPDINDRLEIDGLGYKITAINKLTEIKGYQFTVSRSSGDV